VLGKLAAQRGDLHVGLIDAQLQALIDGIDAGPRGRGRIRVAPAQALDLRRRRFLRSSSVCRAAMTSGCLSVNFNRSSSKRACASEMRATVSPPLAAPPTTDAGGRFATAVMAVSP